MKKRRWKQGAKVKPLALGQERVHPAVRTLLDRINETRSQLDQLAARVDTHRGMFAPLLRVKLDDNGEVLVPERVVQGIVDRVVAHLKQVRVDTTRADQELPDIKTRLAALEAARDRAEEMEDDVTECPKCDSLDVEDLVVRTANPTGDDPVVLRRCRAAGCGALFGKNKVLDAREGFDV